MMKLVRDRVPEIAREHGWRPPMRCRPVASDYEFGVLLAAKLREETGELIDAGSAAAMLAEAADVLQVIHTIIGREGFTPEDLELARIRKARQAGTFAGRLVWQDSDPSDFEKG